MWISPPKVRRTEGGKEGGRTGMKGNFPGKKKVKGWKLRATETEMKARKNVGRKHWRVSIWCKWTGDKIRKQKKSEPNGKYIIHKNLSKKTRCTKANPLYSKHRKCKQQICILDLGYWINYLIKVRIQFFAW